MANFHGFEPRTPSGRLFFGGSGWILASKAYIHYGPWLLCPDEPHNTFLWPLEASKRPKTGLKVDNFHGFEPCTPSGRLFGLPIHPGSIHCNFQTFIFRGKNSLNA